MTSYVASRPLHPEVVVRVMPTPEGLWTARIVANIGRRFTIPAPHPTPLEALQDLWVRASHLDFRDDDIRWLASLPPRLAAVAH